MKTNIERLIARVCEGTDSESNLIRRFFIAYKTFLLDRSSSLYREWIAAFLDEWREYRGQTDIEKIMMNDRALFDNIAANGLKVPVRVNQSTTRVDLSGCHRLICCHVLGYTDIPFADDGVIPYQEVDPALGLRRNSQQDYEKFHWQKEKRGECERSGPEYQEKFKKDLVGCAAWPEGGVALDVGAGGMGGMSAAAKADAWILVDPLMDYYKTLFKQKHLTINGEAELISLPNDSMDTVFCVNALDHGTCRVKGLFEIYRVLKPGGYFGFWTHCRKERELDGGHLQSFSTKRIKEELELVGFIKRGDKVNKGTPDEYIGVFTK